MKGIIKVGLLTLCVAPVVCIFGCKGESAPEPSGNATQNPVANAAPGTKVRKTGGATPDMNEVPAPSGVKTGVLPGGAK